MFILTRKEKVIAISNKKPENKKGEIFEIKGSISLLGLNDIAFEKGIPTLVPNKQKKEAFKKEQSDSLLQSKIKAAGVAIDNIFRDYTNLFTMPDTKKAIRIAVEEGLETSEEIEIRARKILTNKK